MYFALPIVNDSILPERIELVLRDHSRSAMILLPGEVFVVPGWLEEQVETLIIRKAADALPRATSGPSEDVSPPHVPVILPYGHSSGDRPPKLGESLPPV